MTSDLVSVIMPVFNAEKHVSEAIESVLNQSHDNLELIIVDDASSDGSLKRIRGFDDPRIMCIELKENSGAGKARNKGIEAARGRYIAFIDADDIWLKDKLRLQIEFMSSENATLAYSDYFLMNEESKFTHKVISPAEVDHKKMLKNNYIGCLTAIYDTKILGKKYMPNRRKRQDWALWIDILSKTDRAVAVGIPLAAYRKTGNSLSSNKWGLMQENYRFYKEFLGYGTLKSGISFAQFLVAYSWYKMTSVKSID